MSWLPDNPFAPSYGDPQEVEDPNADFAVQETAIRQADIDQDAATIQQALFEALQERAPGWIPRDGNLDVWLIEEFSQTGAEIRQEALNVPQAIYTTYGQDVLGIPMRPSAPAQGYSTWIATDTRGYTIPAGTQITLARTGDELVVFEVVTTAWIEKDTDRVEGVQIVAQENGEVGNDLWGEAEVVDPLMWVKEIIVEQPTILGDDGQDPDAYLEELAMLFRVVALRPILPWDFAILAMRIGGVYRAIAMDGYQPASQVPTGLPPGARADLVTWLNTYGQNINLLEQAAMIRSVVATLTPDADGSSWGHARTVTLILTNSEGQPVATETKAAVHEYLTSLREVNWILYVIDANYEEIDVEYEVTAFAEQDPEFVRELCDEALRNELSPMNFRLGTTSPSIAAGEVIPPQPPGEVPGRQIIRINNLVALLDRVRGVDWVNHDGVLINGSHDDYTLESPITLPEVRTITGTVHEQDISGDIAP